MEYFCCLTKFKFLKESINMNKIFLIITGVILLIQIIPINRDNPVTEQALEINLTGEEKRIIENSCYDCHSNNTVWPWYSYVAPVSWFVVDHVHEARDELNFSEWKTYSQKRINHKLEELVEEVEEEEMPLPSYLLLHSNANLSDEEKQLLINWAKTFNKSTIDTTETEQ